MLSRFNRVREALNDTLITRATDVAFSRLASFYGFPRPLAISTERWRSTLRSSVFSARGTPGAVFRFVEEAFGQWADENSTFTVQGVGPNSLALPSGLDVELEGRFCRINGELYRSTYHEGSVLYFVNVNTPMFRAADFEAGVSYEAKFLPFDIVEQGGVYEVILDGGILGYPPTFLKQDPSVTGDALGGFILEDGALGDALGDGPFPIYLGSDDFTKALGEGFENMLCAGVIGKIKGFAWTAGAASMYGSYKDRVVYGTTAPTAPDIVTPTRG